VLKAEYTARAITEHRMDQCIVFCRTKLDCDNMERFLRARGHTAVCLHADRSPEERSANLAAFKGSF
jgi:ATP-dependent RNA helicase DDX1